MNKSIAKNREKLKSTVAPKNNKLLYSLIIFILIIVLFLTGILQNIYKNITLRFFYTKLTESIKRQDYAFNYSVLVPSDKARISLNEYLAKYAPTDHPYSINFSIESVKIDGNNGFIERTAIICNTQSCLGNDRFEDKATKRYIFINGKWYTPLDNNTTFCSKIEPYPMSEEFNRALSLIIQREEQGSENARNFAQSLKDIKNCLHIKYAESELDMFGTEGYFTFSKNSTKEDLSIIVSPKYQIKDDLLTAILLSHEISHAMFFVGNSPYTCFENEAHAFTNQWIFMLLLNQEEKVSIVTRAYSSTDVHSTLYTLQQIGYQKGDDFYGQALNYVKGNEFYINQCSSQ